MSGVNEQVASDNAAASGKSSRPSFEGDLRSTMRKGRLAANKGDERWSNPYSHMRGRAWTYGWNVQHLKDTGGECDGCKQCGPGTMPLGSFTEWVRSHA